MGRRAGGLPGRGAFLAFGFRAEVRPPGFFLVDRAGFFRRATLDAFAFFFAGLPFLAGFFFFAIGVTPQLAVRQ
jgi:hypothetical protein